MSQQQPGLAPSRRAGCATGGDLLAELDHLLNDPGMPTDADRVWTLVVEIARFEQGVLAKAHPA